MSLANAVKAQLISQGNPVPPGRYVGPGAAMPVYQGNHDVKWDGAARGLANAPSPAPVTKHMGLQSNHYVTGSLVANPLTTGEERNFMEGQILFVMRKEPVAGMTTMTTSHQLNIKCARAYAGARNDLATGNLPQGIFLTTEQFDALNEEDIREYLDNPEDIPEGPENDALRAACRLLKIKHFKYLLPVSVFSDWKLWGAINNLSYATSQPGRMIQHEVACRVVNSVIGKRAFISNQFGGAEHVLEGSKIGFIGTRAVGPDGKPGQPILKPWAWRDAEVPAYCDRLYRDAWGRPQLGFYFPLGTVHEIKAVPAPSMRCLVAAGLRGTDLEEAHQAMGALPIIMVQIGI
jgi:hypothetical protein